MIKIKVAGLVIAIDNRYQGIEILARDYLSDEEPAFTVCATDAQIEKEREASGANFSDSYLESIVVYRNIAEKLPYYDAFVFHGAILNFGGEAFAFTARSGVGKTTHTRLWLERFGDDVHFLNGDKPIIRFIDGIPYACGTPWRGKEGYGVNEIAPLKAIAFLERGEENTAREASPERVVTKLVTQIYMPKASTDAMLKTMKLADRLINAVKLVSLKCNMDISAADVALKALSDRD